MYFRMAGVIVLVALGLQSRINAQSKPFDGFKLVDKTGDIASPRTLDFAIAVADESRSRV